jgi:putative pyruvate formate lyase activating enzyme
MYKPGYLGLLKNGELENRVIRFKSMLESCVLCPHQCRVNRTKGERGYCKTLDKAVVSGAQVHFGEERELVGKYGSGTIFFSHCNLACVFCQNYQISQCGAGREVTAAELADMMINLQNKKCHNINLVSPGHIVPQIVEAVFLAAGNGLTIPVVYNTNGYDLTDTLVLLEGIVDIYMPDIKFADDLTAQKYLGVKKYYSTAGNAVKEMHRQVGDLKTDELNTAYRGLLVRHLVMPGNIAGTEKIMRFIAGEISKETYVNIMAQYYPAHRAYGFEKLKRKITKREFSRAVQAAAEAGLNNIRAFD